MHNNFEKNDDDNDDQDVLFVNLIIRTHLTKKKTLKKVYSQVNHHHFDGFRSDFIGFFMYSVFFVINPFIYRKVNDKKNTNKKTKIK